ncbi:hypothetical protein F2Q70_00039395 [Brassica cretica]|uniref:Uncharacterized protein n=2 Tax=Brassica cretica TaxID=69181 RepID=A0A8S9K6U1_BRACR|nr:hypothetical protein F2Q70_00039395 [Brassica cretica]
MLAELLETIERFVPGGTKACPERLRKEKVNERCNMFIAESPKTDKPTRLDDAIRPEKNELSEEKLPLKAEKERTQSLVPSSGLMAQIPAPFGEDKTAVNLSE